MEREAEDSYAQHVEDAERPLSAPSRFARRGRPLCSLLVSFQSRGLCPSRLGEGTLSGQ